MEKKLGRAPLPVLAAVCAAVGFFLRRAQLAGGGAAALIGFSAVATALFLGLSTVFEKEPEFARVFGRELPDLTGSGLGAALLLIGCVLGATAESGIARWIYVLGAAGALGLLRAATLRYAGKCPTAALHVPSVVFYIAKLFYDYRHWMVDPAITDYCFMLLAMICFMLAGYHAGAFCFDRGSRRTLLFFSMGGVYYGGLSLAGADGAQLLIYGGTVLLLLAVLWQVSALKEPPEAAPEI